MPELTFLAGETKELRTGNFFRFDSGSAALSLQLIKGSTQTGEIIDTFEQGDYLDYPKREDGSNYFDYVKVTSAQAQTIHYTVSIDGKIGSNRLSGDVGIKQGTGLSNGAPVAVTDAAGAIIAAGTRKGLHFRNAGANTVYLGGSGVTVANAAIELLPGEEWRESDGAAAQWFGICSAGLASSVACMAVS